MTNKCPNCGFEYRQEDIFCSRCGTKLNSNKKIDIKSAISQFEYKYKRDSKAKASFSSQAVKKFFDNTAINATLLLLILLFALCVSMFFILNSHHEQKDILQYKNLMQNPAQIPLLKESATHEELAQNMGSVENFLTLYLDNTQDTKEKQEQIFSLYLKELEKLPNILNEKYDSEKITFCEGQNIFQCTNILNNLYNNTAIKVYNNDNLLYLYPDYEFINKSFGKYFSKDIKRYMDLRAKYSTPIDFGLELNIKPDKLAQKIIAFEKLHNQTQNEFIKEETQKILYHDFRKFIFTPSIYATTTHEMKPEFKRVYINFIKKYRNSNLRPLIMSYMDKKRGYNENNFKNDYPYKLLNNDSFSESFKSSVFEDIFMQLRKNIFTDKNSNMTLIFVYDITNGKWKKYDQDTQLSPSEYVISEPDENNNISIYNSAFSPMQELNILKYSKLYLISDGLYAFNKDKLSISKVTFNGKTFNLYTLNHVDITSLFPGFEVINIDSFSNYNTIIDKHNAKANYIILSRYSQGWNDYNLKTVKGEYNQLALPNMFSVNSQSDVIIAFTADEKSESEFSENKPTYKLILHTIGNKETEEEQKQEITNYDEKTKDDSKEEKNEHKPNIMPKLPGHEEKVELENDSLLSPPKQNLDPPSDDKD